MRNKLFIKLTLHFPKGNEHSSVCKYIFYLLLQFIPHTQQFFSYTISYCMYERIVLVYLVLTTPRKLLVFSCLSFYSLNSLPLSLTATTIERTSTQTENRNEQRQLAIAGRTTTATYVFVRKQTKNCLSVQ